jgi:class 3 adenylate cyclase
MSQPDVADSLEAGRDAVARNAWREAFDLLGAADASRGLPPEDLEHLAEAAFWSGRLPACIDAYERAYAAYLEQRNQRRAGVVALELAREYQHKLAHSIAAGWFNRAKSLLEQEPESPEYGYLVLARVSGALGEGALDRALEHARRAVEIGSRSGDRDLEALALHKQGCVLVAKGEVVEGLALLDEATVAAVSGGLRTLTTAIIYCNTIDCCRDLADYRRAGEWTEAATRWCEKQAISGFPGICRVRRAEVMRLRGAWAQAEQEARRACGELQEFVPDVAGAGFYEIGEIRLRLGDLPAAEEAFRQAHELGREPQPGLSLLRLAQGKVEIAAAAIRGALEDESWDRLARARLLPARVEIALAAGDLEGSRAAAEELEGIAQAYASPALEAVAACARAALQLEEGDAAGALRNIRRGGQLWRELDMPYEAARARMQMAAALRLAGDEDSAQLELQSARSAFERLGAAPEARRAAELLGTEVGSDSRPSATRGRRATRTFMFTDIVKSTHLVEALGDDAWEDLLRWHDQTLRSLFAGHGGEEIKQAGDGFFVGFREAPEAIECAVAIQRTLADHRRAHGFAPQVRIGLHAAEAAQLGRDYGGMGVHEAARIAALAEGGEILASRVTLPAGAVRFAASEPRSVSLKGISAPVEVVAIDWR